ncbi:MAG: putative PSP1-like protein [Planctomycetota bacterium]|nr:putative PSP1-like protein [Planctomycetota bacterium]
MTHAYLVRYGVMRHVGRFVADPGAAYRRGDAVIVHSRRGMELGEVLIESEVAPDAVGIAPLLRPASSEDFSRAKIAASDRDRRLAECERIFRDGEWPMELIDVEPLLDDRTVLHYLGPHRLDATGLFQLLRDRCGLNVVLEPVGLDVEDDEEAHDHADDHDHGCGSCGTGGGGGCRTGCGSESGGCSGCAVKDLVQSKRALAAT